MNCAESQLLLHADVDGELDPRTSLELEHHLKSCAACDDSRQTTRQLRDTLRQSELRFRAPDALRERVRRIADDDSAPSRPNFQFQWFWQWLAAGTTALALWALLLRPAGTGDSLASEAVGNHVRSLMAEHLTDVVSSDQHTVKPWFDGKLDFAPDVKDLAAENFPLVGGRLDYLDGHPVAALVYRRNKHLINVFVWPVESRDQMKPGNANLKGYAIVSREWNGLHYLLVSDVNETELNNLADLLGQAGPSSSGEPKVSTSGGQTNNP